MLGDNKYGPGIRQHWALNTPRFSNLIRALNLEPGMDTRSYKGFLLISCDSMIGKDIDKT